MYIYHEFVNPYFFYDKAGIEIVQDPNKQTVVLPTPPESPSMDDVKQVELSVSISNTTLMIPVVGIKRQDLQDTYTDARSEGRVHNAIDIMAAVGTPVVAVSDGEIAKFFDSEHGGITIYQFSPDKSFVYYYAHLQKRAENLQENNFVKQGTVIGYVGDTGNAEEGNYHLHFEIIIPDNPNEYRKGTDINPFPLLKNGIESR